MPHATAPDGVTIAYQVRGAGDPLVLLSGQANSHEWWEDVRSDFEGVRTTITLDYRGTGDSGESALSYSTRQFAEDVVRVLDDLGIDRADVYGTSMGGRVAQWVAASHPARVRGLVLGCTSPGGKHGFERNDEVRRSLAVPDAAKVRLALLDLMYTPAWLATHPGPYRTLGDRRMSPRARRGHLAASNLHDAWDVLPDIAAPTLVVHGDADVFNPAANAPLLVSRIRGARMAMIPGARHGYFEEFREVAGPLVLEFLDRVVSGVE